MKLGIMQPYFFPYIGYFQLISLVDKWIIFDNVQYIRHGWINRNRILHPDPKKEWMYITVPLTGHTRSIRIDDVKISSSQDWKAEILGKITHYKNKAFFYNETRELIEECLSFRSRKLVRLNTFCLKRVCEYLGIGFNYQNASDVNLNLANIDEPGDWALEISKKLKVDEYINPVGGKGLFDENEFKKNGIKLSFLKTKEIRYNQSRRNFVPNLSIIDIMMFNQKSKINNMLNNFNLS